MDKIKILVVDDESRMRKLVKDFLGREGYQVLEAGDGMEAMEVFYDEKDIALIILDVMMPRMDGWQVCREVRQSSKSADHHANCKVRGNEMNYRDLLWGLTNIFPSHSVRRSW